MHLLDRGDAVASGAPGVPEPCAPVAHRPTAGIGVWGPAALFAYATLTASYFVLRTGGRLADIDTGQVALAARSVAHSASILPRSGTIYPSGYAYAVVTDALVAYTGVPLPTVLVVVYPLVSAALVFAAWALYRELTGSAKAAALAVLLLFLQPEFLFAVFRGSHERQVRLLMFVALWLLARSVGARDALRGRDGARAFAPYVALFYLVSFGLVATNALFGISFAVALAGALCLTWAAGRLRSDLAPIAGGAAARIAPATLGLGVAGFAFVAYAYPPAVVDVRALGQVGRQLAALLVTTGGRNPYGAVEAGWIGLPVYFLVSVGDYLLLAASACAWLWQVRSWLAHRDVPRDSERWLLLVLYGAFAVQGAIAVASDRTGLLGGNAEHRSFPSFAMVATPLVAMALSSWHPPRWAASASVGGVAILTLLALAKATDEPILSNTWLFYAPSELQALRWADSHAHDTTIWVGPDGRLRSAYELAVGESVGANTWDAFAPKPGSRTFVVSDVMRLQLSRLGRALPDLGQADRVYDNGAAQLYHLLPESSYQR